MQDVAGGQRTMRSLLMQLRRSTMYQSVYTVRGPRALTSMAARSALIAFLKAVRTEAHCSMTISLPLVSGLQLAWWARHSYSVTKVANGVRYC